VRYLSFEPPFGRLNTIQYEILWLISTFTKTITFGVQVYYIVKKILIAIKTW
jgi:hypothetical protein